MELTVSNPNLHPVWAKVLGITPQTTSPSTSAETQLSPLAAAIAAMTGQTNSHQGWQATWLAPRRPGARSTTTTTKVASRLRFHAI